MNYSFSTEGTIMGIAGSKTDGVEDQLPDELKPIMRLLLSRPGKYKQAPINLQPDEGKYHLHLEEGDQKYDYEFSDFQIPEDIMPLISYLRSRTYS